MSPSDKQHLERVASLGCVVCRYCEHWGDSPAEIHHLLDPATNERLGHDYAIPLCGMHHRGNHNTERCVSRHTGQLKQFEAKYLPEKTLLTITYAELQARWPGHYPEEDAAWPE